MDEVRFARDLINLDKMIEFIRLGRRVICNECGERIRFFPRGNKERHPGLYCKNGCTSILIDYF